MSKAKWLSGDRARGWWRRLLLSFLGAFYLLFTVGAVQSRGVFEYVGWDYLTFRCSAEIAVTSGFAQVYDLEAQERCQHPVYQAYATGPSRAEYATVPTPYLPVFILPFVPLLVFDPLTGFILWTVLNAAGLVFYLRRFLQKVGPSPAPSLLPVLLLSFPVFANLFFGQVNLWLLICLGEFLLAGMRRQDLQAGLWLAGLSLKPQFLALYVLGLLVGRRFKALLGCIAAGLALLAVSLPLAGVTGMVDLGELILQYPQDLATTNAYAMMNWRAGGIHLELLLPSPLAWGIAWGGLALTMGAALFLWSGPRSISPSSFGVAVLGTTAAACAVAWHSHVHMALPLLVALLYLDAAQRLPRGIALVWSTAPPLLFAVAVLTVPGMAHNLVGLALLLLNLSLLVWAARTFWQMRRRGWEELPSAEGRAGLE